MADGAQIASPPSENPSAPFLPFAICLVLPCRFFAAERLCGAFDERETVVYL